MNYSINLLGKILLPALMLVSADLYAVPLPTTNLTDLPAESFAGEEFCFDAPLSNTSADVGYGPYLQLQLPPEITFTSATFNGAPVSSTVLGTLPTPPSGITDPLSSTLVTGTNGYSLLNLQPPIGSIVQGGPSLVMTICGTIDATAPIGNPLTVYTQPIFQFGDTATGANGATLGAQGSATVSPSIVNFIKVLTGSENERPPGPSWPATYELRVDIANSNTIYNLDFVDVLPADLQYVSNSINVGTTGAVCNSNVAGQNISISCDQALGSVADVDLVVTYQVYIKDVLDETQCDDKTLTNTALFNVDRDDGGNFVAVGPLNSSDVLRYEHVKVQKSVTPGVNQGDLVSPSDILTYTLNIQTTDYGVTDSLILTDILPDGLDPMSFTPVSVTLNGGNVAVVHSLTHNNISGTTTITYDIGAITGNIAAGSSLQVVYTAEVEQVYEDGVTSVKANDFLTNNAEITYGLTAGAAACTDTSSATARIKDLSISKSVVNVPVSGEFQPGQTVKYLLSMDIPSGDTSGIVFKDFFPLPVFDVTTIDPIFGVDVVLAPSNTVAGISPSDPMAFDAATNSLTINWPDITATIPQILAIEISIDVGNQPFADNLRLSNLFESGTVNSPNVTISDLGLIDINVRAPVLDVTKGVVATTHGTISPPVGSTPEDSNLTEADSGDTVTYQITVENTGGASAHDVVITDDLGGIISSALLQGCAVISVQDGGGTPLASTVVGGEVTLTNPLPDTGFAIVQLQCVIDSTVQPGDLIINKSSVVWGSGGAGLFPAVEDTASVTIAYPTISKTKLTAGTTFTIGQILRYEIEITVPELTLNDFVIKDQLDPGLAFVSFTTNATLGFSADLTTSTTGDLTTLPSIFNVTNNGTTLTVDLETVVNSNVVDGTLETIILAYDVVVVNDAAANAGNQLNNTATYSLTNNAGNVNGFIDSADEITIVEPNIEVTKAVVTAGPFDAGDMVTYDLFVRQTGSNLSDAFEVSLLDTLPANVTYVGGSLNVASGSCSTGGAPVFANPAANELTTNWVQFTTADLCHIQYSVILGQGILSGTSLQNDVAVEWSSLSGTHDVTKSDYNANSCERTSVNNAGNCGANNDYDAASQANIQIGNVAIAKSLVATSLPVITGDAMHDAGEADLAIGETATFRLVVTLPEGTSDFITITDNLPSAASGVMEYVSSNIISIGTNLKDSGGVAQLTGVTPAISGVGSGTVVEWVFGQVVNIGNDNVVNDDDRIIIEITGIIRDNALNNDGSDLTNNSVVLFGAGLTGTSNVNIDIVEPELQILKNSVTTTADAGDVVTYSMVISHTGASTQEAFDITMIDVVPVGMTYVANTIATSGTCNLTSLPDDTAPGGAGLSVVLDNIPLASSCTVTFDATLDNNVNPGQQITNNASLVWDSLPADNDPNERSYSDADNHLITVSIPGLTKVVTSTSVADTIINAPGTALTIGETVTYQFTVTIPEGDTNNVVILDQLPTAGVALEYVSSQIVSIGSALTIGSGAVVTDAGDDCGTCNSNGDAYRDQAQWDLGTINNPPVVGGKTIVFEVVAIVVDDVVNTYADNDKRNVASITFDDATGGGTTTITGDVGVDLVEPIVTIGKQATPAAAPFFADAGDTVTFEIVVDNSAANNSEANAYNLVVTDTLANDGANALINWNGDANVAGTCSAVPGFAINSTNAAASPFNAVFTVPTLALGTSCTITYEVIVDQLAQPSQTLTNTAGLAYDSTSTAESSGETRTSTTSTTSNIVINDVSGLVKVVASTSHNGATGTGSGQHTAAQEDLTIGESVTYSITMSIPQGTTNNVMLTDTMPTGAGGVIEVVGTPTISLGGAISTSLSAVSVNAGLDGFTINFGTVTNVPDADASNDIITVTVTGIVTDVTDNSDGKSPVNTASFTFTDGAGDPQTKTDTAIVDLVVPEMSISKSMTVLDGLVTVTVALENMGKATAYDIEIKDILDSANWDTGTITPVTVPTGYTLTTVAGPLATETTVVMASNSAMNPPDTSIEVGETITFTFTVLAQPNVATIVNTVTNTGATTLPGVQVGERDVSGEEASQTINIPLIELIKTADALVTPHNVGDIITYNFTINNIGGIDLTNITVVDPMPGVTVTGNSIDLVVGASDSTTIKGTYTVTQADIDSESIDNTASVSAANATGSPVTDSDSTTVNLTLRPELTLLKTADDTTDVVVGQNIIYTYEITNTGNSTIEDITVSDVHTGLGTNPVPGNESILTNTSGLSTDAAVNGSFDSLASGDVATFTSTYVVTQADINDSGDITNIATVTGVPKSDPVNPVTDTNNESVSVVAPDPILTITKVADDDSDVVVGQTITYTYVVTNTGNVAIDNVSITDVHQGNGTAPTPSNEVLTNTSGLSSNTTPNDGIINRLSVGDSVELTSMYLVTQSDIDADIDITNLATANGMATAGTLTFPQVTELVDLIDPAPALFITKDADVSSVIVGNLITYTYVVENIGNVTITNVSISDAHTGLGVLSNPANEVITTNPDTLSADAGVNDGIIDSLSVGGIATFTATYTVLQDDIDAATTITNIATANGVPVAGGASFIPPTADESVATIASAPEMTIVKTADITTNAIAGDIITYTYVVTNIGNVTIDDITITDIHSGTGIAPLPGNEILDPNNINISGLSSDAAVDGSIDSLAPGDAAIFMATYEVTPEDVEGVEDITNVATAEGDARGSFAVSPPSDNAVVRVFIPPIPTLSEWSRLLLILLLGLIFLYHQKKIIRRQYR